ncbi:DUF905 domain-containing protein [Escherichia coli]|nr:DUF905 domain-containing protein [Escherichia coli]EFC3718583.1 DUF905 domain-containing protein [Escherichia coli]EFD5076858.1 DUF905 domain-containing protein [Escherichia coli]EFF9366651.1 DUF905 domain-containing protein [Escherichia coli]EJG3879697.1 DUF905 family protein [Escherichia coli]
MHEGCTLLLFPEGPFSCEQVVAVTTTYSNVFTEDDLRTHFRLVIRNAGGQLRWCCRNSEPDTGTQLNTRLVSEGLLRQ